MYVCGRALLSSAPLTASEQGLADSIRDWGLHLKHRRRVLKRRKPRYEFENSREDRRRIASSYATVAVSLTTRHCQVEWPAPLPKRERAGNCCSSQRKQRQLSDPFANIMRSTRCKLGHGDHVPVRHRFGRIACLTFAYRDPALALMLTLIYLFNLFASGRYTGGPLAEGCLEPTRGG